MSQIYKKNNGSGPLPPTVPLQFSTDVNGPAIPAANNLNVFGFSFVDNMDHGVFTNGLGDILYVGLSNRSTATLTTTDAIPSVILTFPLPAVAGTYYVYGNIEAFTSTGPSGGAYSFSGGYLTDGANAIELGTEFHDTFQSASLVTTDIALSASANNIVVTVTGVAATSINWNLLLEYRQAN